MKCIHLEGMSFWQTLKKISSVSFLNVEKNHIPQTVQQEIVNDIKIYILLF